jgi:hypothetical protein
MCISSAFVSAPATASPTVILTNTVSQRKLILPELAKILWHRTTGGDADRVRASGHPDLPVRLGVAVPLRAPDGNGLPSQAEGEQLNAIEDLLFGAIQGSGTGRIVLILTTSGMREFVSYARSKDAAVAAIRSAGQSVKTHKLQAYTAPDPEWKLFRQFAS